MRRLASSLKQTKEGQRCFPISVVSFRNDTTIQDQSLILMLRSKSRAVRLNSLAAALIKRYDINDSAPDFANAVTASSESIRLTPKDGIERSLYLNTLARIYYMRLRKTKELDTINLAIKVAKEAVETCTDMSRGEHLILLRQSLKERYKLNESTDDLAAAVDAFAEGNPAFNSSIQPNRVLKSRI